MVAEGAAGVATALPPAGGLAAAGAGELVPVEELLDEGRAPPTPPSMVKGPAKARSGEFPSSKASKIQHFISISYHLCDESQLTFTAIFNLERNLPDVLHVLSIDIGSNGHDGLKSSRGTLCQNDLRNSCNGRVDPRNDGL